MLSIGCRRGGRERKPGVGNVTLGLQDVLDINKTSASSAEIASVNYESNIEHRNMDSHNSLVSPQPLAVRRIERMVTREICCSAGRIGVKCSGMGLLKLATGTFLFA